MRALSRPVFLAGLGSLIIASCSVAEPSPPGARAPGIWAEPSAAVRRWLAEHLPLPGEGSRSPRAGDLGAPRLARVSVAPGRRAAPKAKSAASARAPGDEPRGERPAKRSSREDVDAEQLPPADAEEPSDDPAIDPAMPPELSPMQAYARPAPALDPERVLVSIAKVTHVYAEPRAGSKKIGYLRAGAVVRRSAEPVGFEGCREGFYEVVPQGYVCVGRTASIDPEHPIARAVMREPDRQAPLPYRYGISPLPGAPLYTRIPTEEEQRQTEKDLHWHLAHSSAHRFDSDLFDAVPWFLRDGAPSFSLHGYRFSTKHVYLRYAIPNSGFSFISFFESGGRKYGLTVDMTIVPLDRLRPVEPSDFHGLPLTGDATLPVVFVHSKSAALYRGDPKREGLKLERRLEYREAIPITGKRVRVGGRVYLETRSGNWIRDRRLVRVDPMQVVPSWANPGRSWIDVSILDQTLVAYEGTTPVFATLVSTGIDGIKDHTEHHATIQGRFLIHTKHVAVTMSSDEVGDEFDLRDVPYVQYFTQGYALHAAYWHDAYGLPKSHGCVNLSPLDARWLFGWTDPPVPQGWHGAMSLHDGTLVYIHP